MTKATKDRKNAQARARRRHAKEKKATAKNRAPGYSNFGGGGPFAPMGSPGLGYLPVGDESAVKKAKRKSKRLPTLAECEKALGQKAETWVGRCYEISRAIVEAGLVDGEAVYGHWTGDVHTRSIFARKSAKLPFVQHGWILLKDGRIFDPTRWTFEMVEPYLFVGEPPDPWGATPCANCNLLREEHREDGPEDQCEMYEPERWPYDEGGNEWREAMTMGRPKPVPEGPRKPSGLTGFTATWVSAVLDERDVSTLAVSQIFYLANMSYTVLFRAVGAEGVKMIYNAIADFDSTSIAAIPIDNVNRAKRECGFDCGY